MPKYKTADGVSVECSEEQAAFLGYDKASKKPAPKATEKDEPAARVEPTPPRAATTAKKDNSK